MVVTIAFGIGIDKEDIRNVVRYRVLENIYGWVQELGRAGRDSQQSTASYSLSYV